MTDELVRAVKELNLKVHFTDESGKLPLPLWTGKTPEKSFKLSLWKKKFKYGEGFDLHCMTKYQGKRYKVSIFLNLYQEADDKSKIEDKKVAPI